ncbi:MAG: hypothetical protein L6R35_004908 [Caloplaca aegaea]|nr:MAG: hypothetical protein L6R35_004908 [Caloplaca aegaea]
MAPKAKGQKMDLGTFLTDTCTPPKSPFAQARSERLNANIQSSPGILGRRNGRYADACQYAICFPSHVDDTFEVETDYFKALVLTMTLTKSLAERGYSVREQLPLPSKPPFTVHLGNMSFDSTEGDVHDFFGGCEVTSVRIVEDKLDRKPKGFAYAEFATLEGLKRALDLSGTQFQGRNIRISVADPPKDRPDAREFNDWTRKGPLPDLPGQRRASDRGGFGAPRSFDKSFDNISEAGSDRSSRRPFEQGDGKVRDFGNWERKGPLQPSAPAPSGPPRSEMTRPVSRDGPSLRRNSPAWGEGRSQEGSRPPRREFVERPAIERAPTAAEKDSQWRNNMRPDAPTPAPVPARSPAMSTRNSSTPSSPLAAPAALPTPAAPAERPKLNLQKRTFTEAPPEAQPMQRTESKSNPFGAAKPIDTATKEKEIEEKRQAALKERKEAEEKAREEKKIADDKAREEKRLVKEAEKSPTPENATTPKEKPNGVATERENGASGPPPGKNYEILRRQANEEAEAADAADAADEEPEGAANGVIVDDQAIKPKEIVRDNISAANGNSPGTPVEPSADTLEDDGWSTVSKPQKKSKNPRNGNMASRAIAS